jgi:hypothetical protein
MPGGLGFLGLGFLSDRVESLMLSFQKPPGARERGNPVGHAGERPRVDIPLKSYTLHLNEAARLRRPVPRQTPSSPRVPTCPNAMLVFGGLVSEGPGIGTRSCH